MAADITRSPQMVHQCALPWPEPWTGKACAVVTSSPVTRTGTTQRYPRLATINAGRAPLRTEKCPRFTDGHMLISSNRHHAHTTANGQTRRKCPRVQLRDGKASTPGSRSSRRHPALVWVAAGLQVMLYRTYTRSYWCPSAHVIHR